MKVREIMTAQIEMIDSEETVTKAAKQMQSFDLGLLPVTKGKNQLVGVITDRDIVLRSVALGLDPNKTKVCQIMTPNVKWCSQEESLEQAAKQLEENQIHRLLVCDDQNRPIGVFSVTDLVRRTHNEHLTCEVLEKICAPAHAGV